MHCDAYCFNPAVSAGLCCMYGLLFSYDIIIVASWCLLFSYCSHLKTTTNLNGILATLTLASMGIVKFY